MKAAALAAAVALSLLAAESVAAQETPSNLRASARQGLFEALDCREQTGAADQLEACADQKCRCHRCRCTCRGANCRGICHNECNNGEAAATDDKAREGCLATAGAANCKYPDFNPDGKPCCGRMRCSFVGGDDVPDNFRCEESGGDFEETSDK